MLFKFFSKHFLIFTKTPWQEFRDGEGFQRHLLSRVSWHISLFKTDGRSAVNKSFDQGSTNDRLVLICMNLAYNVDTDMVCEEGLFLVVYCVLRLRLSCFVVYSAVNVDKAGECNRYISYIKIVFSNNCHSKII
jgi:hypothetical protein